MSFDNRLNPGKGTEFQRNAAQILAQYFDTHFHTEYQISIGNPPKPHKFDLVSSDMRYVGECKNHSWTVSGNVPSAKMAFINEAVFYLSWLPTGIIRFVVLRKDIHVSRGESLAEYYYRTYRHLLGDVLIIELETEMDPQLPLASRVKV